MISVVIPVVDESETIGSVVEFARRNEQVSEVIVVDDGSIDGTPELARDAGATVVTSTLLGKGASMEDGMRAARNDILLYLDGDLRGLREDLIEAMTRPIVDDQADFVKARFSRSAGRVTTLTARPLLRLFFPELAHFEQPLGGIIAARRELLARLRFENDYGVDVGLLLDAAAAGARVVEVDIGHIEHDSHSLEVLGDMAGQVVRSLLARASRCGRLRIGQIREMAEVERQMQAELSVALQRVGQVQRLALFDMDGTLLDGRFVESLAGRTDRQADLAPLLDNYDLPAPERTRRIAGLFRGVPIEAFEEAARAVPLVPGAVDAVVGLRRAGYRVGIVTDSFHIAAEIVRRRVFADFTVAHLMKFRRGKATGNLTLSPPMASPRTCTKHDYCKLNVMHHLLEKMGIDAGSVLAVGDSENDVCLLQAAGTSVAFQPKTEGVRAAAGHVVDGDLSEILDVVLPRRETAAG
ncbi:MAG: HAD-IB family phosphatase [Planctomycetia bacterium]|nr:HAD-IB family phosphatase [Planctomycetia bacterium]